MIQIRDIRDTGHGSYYIAKKYTGGTDYFQITTNWLQHNFSYAGVADVPSPAEPEKMGKLFICNIKIPDVRNRSRPTQPPIVISEGQVIDILRIEPDDDRGHYIAKRHAYRPRDEFEITNDQLLHNFSYVGSATGGRRRKSRKTRKTRKPANSARTKSPPNPYSRGLCSATPCPTRAAGPVRTECAAHL